MILGRAGKRRDHDHGFWWHVAGLREYIARGIVVDAVKRLTPDTFIGMHVAATPWTRLTTVLESLARQ